MTPDLVALALFTATYLLVAIGRIPGLALDRTGFALLGALAFLATGRVTLDQAKEAVDAPTIVILFAMMLLSAQYQISGLYGVFARRLGRIVDPRRLLAGTIAVSALLAMVLTNDVVCFALTPLIGAPLIAARRDPLPYFLAIACGTNIGSAATPIGNPQNILLAQRMSLEFGPFLAATLVPVVLALVATYWLLRKRVGRELTTAASLAPPSLAVPPSFDRREAWKAVALTAGTIGLFLSPVPTFLTAAAVAGIVLTSRKMHSRTMLGLVDWHLLTLFFGLFVVTRGLELSGWTERGAAWLIAHDLDLGRLEVLIPITAVGGNLIGNVPLVMLLVAFVPNSTSIGLALAMASSFAGNALLVGSIANLIVAEQAAKLGAPFGFRDHLRIGLPVTAISLLLAVFWLSIG